MFGFRWDWGGLEDEPGYHKTRHAWQERQHKIEEHKRARTARRGRGKVYLGAKKSRPDPRGAHE